MNKNKLILSVFIVILMMLGSLILVSSADSYFPSPSFTRYTINSNSNGTLTPQTATSSIPVAGAHSLLDLNAQSQTSRWQAYVGNVDAKLGLNDNNNRSLHVWNVSKLKGEIFATRHGSLFDWQQISCANVTHIYSEESALAFDSSFEDSINNTFTTKNHSSFYASTTFFDENDCLSIKTLVNNSVQNSTFEEVLLYNDNNLMYTSIMVDETVGFNGQQYNFQLILPNYFNLDTNINTKYFFYVEID